MGRTRRKALAAAFPVLIVASLLSVAMVSPASGDERLDLSSDAAIVDYLGSIGVDLDDVVWQRGLHNYAGPNCPGPGWSCVSANRPVVQITTPLGANQYHCTGPECIAVQSSGDDDGDDDGDNGDDDGDDGDDDGDDGNVATCEMHSSSSSSSSNVLQVCIIGQESADGSSNAASIKMSIQQSNGSRTSTQTARQVGRITQVNTTGKNVASIWQSIDQSQSASGGMTISQTEEAHQGASVDQGTTSGDNVSDIEQWQNQSQRAERTLGSITQNQNTAVGTDFFCDGSALGTAAYDQEKNQCAEVAQDSSVVPAVGGDIDSDLTQKVKESQTASKASTVNQQQGSSCLCLGQQGKVTQNSSAPDDSDALQETIQVQWANAAPSVMQLKDAGDPRCCATQTVNPGSTADITQRTIQFASSDGAIQTAEFRGECESAGSCHVRQSATIDGDTETNECSNGPPGFCNAVLFCTEEPVGENGGTETVCVGDETSF
jgi:hypothetical protein